MTRTYRWMALALLLGVPTASLIFSIYFVPSRVPLPERVWRAVVWYVETYVSFLAFFYVVSSVTDWVVDWVYRQRGQ